MITGPLLHAASRDGNDDLAACVPLLDVAQALSGVLADTFGRGPV